MKPLHSDRLLSLSLSLSESSMTCKKYFSQQIEALDKPIDRLIDQFHLLSFLILLYYIFNLT